MTAPATLLAPPAAIGGIRFRRWAGIHDVDGMAAANQRLRARCGVLEPVDAVAMRHRYTHLVNSDPLTDCILAVRDAETVGYARAEWHDLTDGDRVYDGTFVLAPDAWGLGVMDTFIDWVEARARQQAVDNPTGRRSWFGTGTFDGDAELEATLAARGYVPVRWDAEMLRPTMDDLPAVEVPPGYAIRPVRPEDLPAVFAMNVEAFREHWGESEETGDELSTWVDDPRFDIDLVSVVWHGDEPAACVSVQVQEHADGGPIAYVDGVATHPRHRRRGLARAALADALHRVAALGLTRASLGVDTDNRNRAFALYEDAGFHKASGSAAWRKPFTEEEPG